ncbi:MAG: 4Fe-4S binding protein [Syntrophorhabdaceae bacterium]
MNQINTMTTARADKVPVKEMLLKAKRARLMKQIPLGTSFIILVIAGWSYPLIGYFIPLCMIAGVGLAMVRGRQWCNWMCPRGSFSDTYMKMISPGKKIPAWLRKVPVRTGVIFFLMSMLTFQIIRLWPDVYAIGGFFVTLLTITTIIGIFMAISVHQRAWCSICPIGSLSSWAGKMRYPLRMAREACVNCKICTKNCPMQLAPNEMRENGAMAFCGDCLKCGICVAGCPTKALGF